jgi:Fic family protein
MAIRYELPKSWSAYDLQTVMQPLIEAKAAMLALRQIPYQRSWADELQKVQLKREVAGTSRIEGAEFTERELDAALQETPAQLVTRSQRQAASAVRTYRWIATLPADYPVDDRLILEVHRQLVTGCDDDHCPPGQPRGRDQNVTFGVPRHRGVDGGEECLDALRRLAEAVRTTFRQHEPIIQALALHYQFAAMHPFLDGNGRTARALEALMLQREGLRDTLFIAMSNYYYEEKTAYLRALSDSRFGGHDLTPFLTFALKGIQIQCQRLFGEIRQQVAKALYRNTVTDLFGRLKSARKRVMSGRHVQLIYALLEEGELSVSALRTKTSPIYTVKGPVKALIRDLNYLIGLKAIKITKRTAPDADLSEIFIDVNLEWPTQITETAFFRQVKEMPKGKVYSFLSN